MASSMFAGLTRTEKTSSVKHWEDCPHEHAIHPVQQFDYTKS